MINNCIVTIRSFSGTKDNKALSALANGSGVRALIVPAGTEVVALYPDLPIGQSFSYTIISDAFTNLTPESEIKVTDAMGSELAVNDTFIVQGANRKNKIAGQVWHSGVCVRKDK